MTNKLAEPINGTMQYTSCGKELHSDAWQALEPIVRKYTEAGYEHMHMYYIINSTVSSLIIYESAKNSLKVRGEYA